MSKMVRKREEGGREDKIGRKEGPRGVEMDMRKGQVCLKMKLCRR